MTLEQVIKEALQSKSHKFDIGYNVLKISFAKDETATINDILIIKIDTKEE